MAKPIRPILKGKFKCFRAMRIYATMPISSIRQCDNRGFQKKQNGEDTGHADVSISQVSQQLECKFNGKFHPSKMVWFFETLR